MFRALRFDAFHYEIRVVLGVWRKKDIAVYLEEVFRRYEGGSLVALQEGMISRNGQQQCGGESNYIPLAAVFVFVDGVDYGAFKKIGLKDVKRLTRFANNFFGNRNNFFNWKPERTFTRQGALKSC